MKTYEKAWYYVWYDTKFAEAIALPSRNAYACVCLALMREREREREREFYFAAPFYMLLRSHQLATIRCTI